MPEILVSCCERAGAQYTRGAIRSCVSVDHRQESEFQPDHKYTAMFVESSLVPGTPGLEIKTAVDMLLVVEFEGSS